MISEITYPKYFVSSLITSDSAIESNNIVHIMQREYIKMNGRLRPKDEVHLSDHVPRIGTKSKHRNGPRKLI